MIKKTILLIVITLLFGCTSHPVNINPEAAKYNVALGVGYLQQKQYAVAKQKLLLALQQAPSSAEAQAAMGYFYLTIGEPSRAAHYYQRAIKLAPDVGEIQNNYGVFLCRTGKRQEAVKYFLMAAKQPNYLHSADAYANARMCGK